MKNLLSIIAIVLALTALISNIYQWIDYRRNKECKL